MAYLWEKSYPPGVSWDAPLPPPVPLESLLETAASKWPERIAIDFYDRTFTFRELHDLAARAAKGLQALGVGPGVHVGLHLPNTPHFVIAFFAVLMAGGRVVNFSPLVRTARTEISDRRRRDDGDGHARVADALSADCGAKGHSQVRDAGCLQHRRLPAGADRANVWTGGGARRQAPAARSSSPHSSPMTARFERHRRGPLEDEVAVLQYTGGTTGQPKGAMLTHANFCAVLNIYSYWNGLGPDEEPQKALAVLPLFHIFGLSFVMLLAVATGSQMVLHIRFDPDRVLADIARKKITAFPAVPTMYTALVNHPKVKEFDLSSVSIWGSGGAPLPLEVQQRFEALTGLCPKEGYGLTEVAPLGDAADQGRAGTPGQRRAAGAAYDFGRGRSGNRHTRCCQPARRAKSASAGRKS